VKSFPSTLYVYCVCILRRSLLSCINIDLWKASWTNQELWYLDPLRFSFRYPQHVQGIPFHVSCWSRWKLL
jgi:hypothetical protein